MKPDGDCRKYVEYHPAAFRRLCVETEPLGRGRNMRWPAAFRRLCVETNYIALKSYLVGQPPSGGCVLKHAGKRRRRKIRPSRLQAAVC